MRRPQSRTADAGANKPKRRFQLRRAQGHRQREPLAEGLKKNGREAVKQSRACTRAYAEACTGACAAECAQDCSPEDSTLV